MTKGPFALFYGGAEIIPRLSTQSSGSHLSVAYSFSLSLLFLMVMFKKLKTRNLPTQQRLKELVVTNYLNVFSMFFIMVILVFLTLQLLTHKNTIQKNSSLAKDKTEKSPDDYWVDLLIIAMVETVVQSISFITNPALR